MNPTSTEAGSSASDGYDIRVASLDGVDTARSDSGRGGAQRPFVVAISITIAFLAVACAVFVLIGYFQGPRLDDGQVDTAGVVSKPDQQLRLFANQTLAKVTAEQIAIKPSVPITVTNTGEVIAIQFSERLKYATDYTVSVKGVTSTFAPSAATLEYSFTTASPRLTVLDRGVPDDEVTAISLTGSERKGLHAGERIQSFAPLVNSIAVVSLLDDHSSTLELVSRRDDVVERVPVTRGSSLDSLNAASSGTLLGFTVSSVDAGIGQVDANTLYVLDLQAGRTPRPILGIDGQPLDVLGWQFVPSSSQLLALNIDRTLLLIDPTNGSITPLGQFTEFGRVSSDGTVATMVDAGGPVAVRLADGERTRLAASPVEGMAAFLGATDVLANGDRIEKVVVPDPSGTRFGSFLAYDDGETSRVLYQTPEGKGSITDFSVSPNGQYVAIETVPDNSATVSDGYFIDARATSTTTVIVDIATGAQVRSVEGFGLTW